MSDSAEWLDFVKPNPTERVVPAPIDWEAELGKISAVRRPKRTALPSGSGKRSPRLKATKESQQSDLPLVRADAEEQPDFLDRATKILPSWLVSLLMHILAFIFLALYIMVPEPKPAPLSLAVSMTQGENVLDTVSVNFELTQADAATDAVDVDQPIKSSLEEILNSPVDSFVDSHFDDFDTPVSESLADARTDDAFAAVNAGTSSALAAPVGEEAVEEGQGQSKGQSQGQGQSAKGASFYGIESTGNRFVFVIDSSVSMLEQGRFVRAVYELTRSLKQLGEDQEFLVMFYGDNIFPMLGTKIEDAKLIKATVENRERVIQWMRNHVPDGRTYPMQAMQQSLQVRPDAIFFLSDGVLDDDTAQLLRTANRGSRSAGDPKIPVHTIALNSISDALKVMQTIAEENEGEFVWVR